MNGRQSKSHWWKNPFLLYKMVHKHKTTVARFLFLIRFSTNCTYKHDKKHLYWWSRTSDNICWSCRLYICVSSWCLESFLYLTMESKLKPVCICKKKVYCTLKSLLQIHFQYCTRNYNEPTVWHPHGKLNMMFAVTIISTFETVEGVRIELIRDRGLGLVKAQNRVLKYALEWMIWVRDFVL